MTANLSRRVRVLELKAARLRGGVVFHDPAAETPQEAAARANRGPVLVMPWPVPEIEWQRAVMARQARLLARAAIYLQTGRDPGD